MHTLNVYSSGDDMDTESDEISADDNFASHDSNCYSILVIMAKEF